MGFLSSSVSKTYAQVPNCFRHLHAQSEVDFRISTASPSHMVIGGGWASKELRRCTLRRSLSWVFHVFKLEQKEKVSEDSCAKKIVVVVTRGFGAVAASQLCLQAWWLMQILTAAVIGGPFQFRWPLCISTTLSRVVPLSGRSHHDS